VRRRVVLVARPSDLVRLVGRSFVCSDPVTAGKLRLANSAAWRLTTSLR
jgi:hypothetical protein